MYIINYNAKMLFIIQELNILEFDNLLFAFKVNISKNVIRVDEDKILSRKTYSLWTYAKEKNDSYFISLKYNDD